MALQMEGMAWSFGDDINTDLILPGAAFLLPVEEQIKHCFSANRPGWCDKVQPGDVIVAGRNFGVGSARPIGNVFACLGVAGVIAASFNGLGLRNCVNYGVHVLPCPEAVDSISDGDHVAVDWTSGIIRNLTRGNKILGNPVPLPLLDIAQAGGVLPALEAEGFLEDVK